MPDKVTTNFPKVGKTQANPRNASGMPTTATRPRGGAVSAGNPDAMMVKGRKPTVNENLGPVHCPQTTYAPAEDPSVSAQLRNTRMLKPAKSTAAEFRRAGSGFPGGA